LIEAIAERREEPEPYHNLVLAAECLRDVGEGRVSGDLLETIRQQLRRELETPLPKGRLASIQLFLKRRMTPEELAQQRIAAAHALAQVGGTRYWRLPYGEPEWVEIPTGEFWMGEGKKAHRIHLDTFHIARVPVTNAQYRLFVEATDQEPPEHWEEGRPPKGRASHPVVDVSWHDALAYCEWLSEVTGKSVTLPSEAEWEKAARGSKDKRAHPWGDKFDAKLCNSNELGLGDTTPVGIFLDGASPYGVLDMVGNVWEWTRSLYGDYPYDPDDGRENLEGGGSHVVRGGAFYETVYRVRCAARDYRLNPSYRNGDLGFRVVVSPFRRTE
jgi:formylglycine-generating enzyme required for sulfatase activity